MRNKTILLADSKTVEIWQKTLADEVLRPPKIDSLFAMGVLVKPSRWGRLKRFVNSLVDRLRLIRVALTADRYEVSDALVPRV